MRTVRGMVFGLGLAAAMAASAQYQWIDRDGRRVFSDTPPPPGLPEKNLIARPHAGAAAPTRAAVAPPPAAKASPASAAAPQRPSDTGDAAKQKIEQEQAAIRADNCKRATAAKATLDSGMRLARVNERGEREIIDDSQRDAEQQRLQQIIASECR